MLQIYPKTPKFDTIGARDQDRTTGETNRGFEEWIGKTSDGMANQAGTIFRGKGHCPEYSEIFPTTTFHSGWSTSDRTRMEADRVRPRWFGQDMSGVPDSGIGRTQDTFRPTVPQPGGRKRRAGDRGMLGPDIERPVRREGALWGTPRKRTLFRSDGQSSISSGSEVPEGNSGWPPDDEYPEMAQSGWSPEDECLEETRSPKVKLVDTVLRLLKELEEFWAESGYGSAGRSVIPAQTSGGSRFTSTAVPMYAGKPSCDQYRHVFVAIVCSNGWDRVTAALQLVSHLEGDALNVALLVLASQRVLPGVLMGALSEHYGSPGRLAEYRQQFERASRSPGDDPSVFAIELDELEPLARRAFADVNASVRLQLVRYRLIAGQAECSLHRHLYSEGPDTHIRDIVDRCCVWESHAEDTDKWGVGRRSERPWAVYKVASVDMDSKPKDASEDSDVLGLLMRHLLPTPAVSPPKATSILTDRELLLQHLLGTVNPVQPVVQECSGIMDIEVLLQSLLPVTSVAEDSVRPPTDRLEPSTRCFSCGGVDHVTPRCPVLNESFPFLPPGWRADRVDDEFVLRPPPRGANCPPAGNVN